MIETLPFTRDIAERTRPIYDRAKDVIRALGPRRVMSTQVLQEFFWITTKKLGMAPAAAREIILEMNEGEVISTTPSLLSDAVDLTIVTGYTIWDSLIVQAAIASRCEKLLTEDLSHGRAIKGVRIENPFVQ